VVALLCLVGLMVLPAAAAPAAPTAPTAPSVLVLGDSYASGEGLPSAEGVCGTEAALSWPALVAQHLQSTHVRLLACSGATVTDVTVGGPLGREPQLAAAAAGGPADLVLLTIGGNDLGFTDIVGDCLGFAGLDEAPSVEALEGASWSDLVGRGEIDRGCDVSQAELLDRVTDLAASDRFVVDSEGGTGGLAALHASVVEQAVAEGGRLVVVGYPALFAEVARWADRYGQRCHGLGAADAEALGRVVVALDEEVAAEVAAANVLLGADVVEYVSVLAVYDGSADGEDHRLCGGGTPWLNGLTVAEGGIDVARLLVQLGAGADGLDLEALGARPGGSFHPSTAGHRGTAAAVLDALGD